jgi:hypothetical protein
MNIEIKHLAAYLPYKLRIKYQERNQVMNLGQGHSTHWIGIKSVINWQNVNGEPPKPILRPLSDLTKEIDNTDDLIYSIINELSSVCDAYWEWLDSCNSVIIPDNLKQAPYELIISLLENHYDIYGLIDDGLAIDINTLNQ